MIELDGALRRPHRLRGHLGPGLARERRGGRGRPADRQLLGLARTRAARAPRASGWSPSAPATTAPPSRSATRSAARTSSSSTAAASSSRPDGETHRPRRPVRARAAASATCCCPPTVRRPAGAGCSRATVATAPHRGATSSRASPSRSEEREVYEALVLGRARLRRQERLRGGRPRPLGWDRLGAGGAWWPRTPLGPERVSCVGHALPPLQRRDPGRRPRDRRQPRRRADRDPDRRPDGAPTSAPSPSSFAGHRARHRRGEPAGADPRQPADGALEQVRLARPHHRQQERDVGRLRDALRRHGGRLRRDQGRAQDARLPARPRPQRARGPRARAGLGARAPPVGRAPRPTSSTRTRCRPTRSSTASSRATSRATRAASSSSPPGFPRTSSPR